MVLLPDDDLDGTKLLEIQPTGAGQRYFRLQPELGLSPIALYVNMHARLFPGKEEEPAPSFPENGRAHP
jgi:hypothetical protein